MTTANAVEPRVDIITTCGAIQSITILNEEGKYIVIIAKDLEIPEVWDFFAEVMTTMAMENATQRETGYCEKAVSTIEYKI